MANNPLISIIVPVYNAEKYLEKCLNSLINQTYKNIEIICVNDGSPDGSINILEEFSKKDSRLKVVMQENQGLSGARNTGLKYVQGEYIAFLDSDDWLDEVTFENALKHLFANDADIVCWTYIREFATKSMRKNVFDEDVIVFEGEKLHEIQRRQFGLLGSELKKVENADALATAWGKLYKASLILENGLLFTDTKIIGTLEDGLFNMEAFQCAKKIVFVNEAWSHYRKDNDTSLTTKHHKNLYEKMQNLFTCIDNLIVKYNLPSDYKEALNNRISIAVFGAGLNVLTYDANTKTKKKMIKGILQSQEYKEAVKGLKLKYFKLHWKVFYWCAKHGCVFGVYSLLKIIKKIIGK